jgi:hypothetical protein
VPAAALSLGIFCGWALLGYATLAALQTRRRTCQRLLTAPAVGIAVVVLPTFWLSRAGLPVARFGPGLAVALVLAAAALLAWRRPLTPVRPCLPFAAGLLVAWILTGRPLLTFGFDWLSYANDDMGNYGLMAFRLLHHGMGDPPVFERLERGLDYSEYYWIYEVAGVRPGAQLLLAWLASVTRLTVHQVFMPCLLAAHLALIAAASALVYQSRRHRPAAVATCWVLAGSAVLSLGTLYQLVAQVLGLGLLCALAAILFQPAWSVRPRRLRQLGILAGIPAAGLAVVYPELLPFFGLGAAAYLTWRVARQVVPVRSVLVVLAAAGLVGLAALNTFTRSATTFLLTQAAVAATLSASDWVDTLFPYVLLPSGLAQLWGLQPLGGVAAEPRMSLTIAAGGLLLVVAVWAALAFARRGEPVAFFCAGMLAVGLGLATGRSTFGLFKLAMFIQPFLLGTLVVAWFSRVHGIALRTLPFLLLGLANLPVQGAYLGPAQSLRSVAVVHPPTGAVAAGLDLDTPNIVFAKLQAIYLADTPATFLSGDFFSYLISGTLRPPGGSARYAPIGYEPIGHDPADRARLARLRAVLESRRRRLTFPLPDGPDGGTEFSAPAPMASAESVAGGALALTAGAQSVLNRRRLGDAGGEPVLVKPYTEVSGHLIFVDSSRGQHYYGALDYRRIGLFQLEPDPLYPGRTMAGLGRHLLLRVVNPPPAVRLAVDLSASFKGDGEARLPPAAVVGDGRVPLPLVGRGSARVFSPVIAPRSIGGRPYVMLDMGVDGAVIPIARTGLMKLYGRGLTIDSRTLVAFGRDVSLVSDEEYRALAPPAGLTRFPDDLANPNLEYSGVFEDGWISGHAYLRLARPAGRSMLVVRGRPPPAAGDASPDLVVALDGQELARQPITGAELTLRLDVAPGPARARIDLRVSRLERLPPPDHRQVGLLLRSIGFER